MCKRNIIIAAAVIFLGIAGYFLPHEYFEKRNIIYIHVTGAVKDTGIVAITVNDTVMDAIGQAGGALPLADLAKIDGTRKLTHTQLLYIPFR